MVRASRRSTSSAQVLVQSCGQTDGTISSAPRRPTGPGVVTGASRMGREYLPRPTLTIAGQRIRPARSSRKPSADTTAIVDLAEAAPARRSAQCANRGRVLRHPEGLLDLVEVRHGVGEPIRARAQV